MKKLILFAFMTLQSSALWAQEDPYIWLEEVDGTKAMEFVKTQNDKTVDVLKKNKVYDQLYSNTLKVLNSKERIVYATITGEYAYNFWQDSDHERGIWRRQLKSDYESGQSNWEILLDVDALSKKEQKKWVFHGATPLYPGNTRYLISLSNGGGDANEVREFDVRTKSFVSNGFFVPEAKCNVQYWDENTLIIASDFGQGTLTESGYPKSVKLWKRGTPLAKAKTIFDGKATDVFNSGYVLREEDKKWLFVHQSLTFYTQKEMIYADGKLIPIPLPEDASINGIKHGKLIVSLKSDWEVNGKKYAQGSLLVIDFEPLLKKEYHIEVLFQPATGFSLESTSVTKNLIILNILNNVKSELYQSAFVKGKWITTKIKTPELGTLNIVSIDRDANDFYYTFENFLEPTTLFAYSPLTGKSKKVQSLPAFFPAEKYKVEQLTVKSTDGIEVPYFVIAKKDVVYDGTNPTLLYGYGGFEVSLQPSYSGGMGLNWLENGGVYVLANIRGGGEFGPAWHQAGLKEKRQIIYDDFAAIAQDLSNRKITSARHLGIMGGSNGGLLMGVAFTQHPELYTAVVCQVPLLDMQRFNKLLAGASWMGEYGNPDIPEEWAFIKKYSPYQNISPDKKYPEVFFMTSTRDDRVHPGHARKMAAKMIDMGYKIYYYENVEGGHGGSSTNDQRAQWNALQYTYLLEKLKS